jgi:hypothetical protein
VRVLDAEPVEKPKRGRPKGLTPPLTMSQKMHRRRARLSEALKLALAQHALLSVNTIHLLNRLAQLAKSGAEGAEADELKVLIQRGLHRLEDVFIAALTRQARLSGVPIQWPEKPEPQPPLTHAELSAWFDRMLEEMEPGEGGTADDSQ